MTSYEMEYLEKMYDDCLNYFPEKEASLICLILSKTKNAAKQAIKRGKRTTKNTTIETLINMGYVREVDGEFLITAKGIFQVEQLRQIDINHYIRLVDDIVKCEQIPLIDKNRIVLLSLFACRCFNTDCVLNRTKHNAEIAKLFQDAEQFLLDNGMIQKKCFGKKTSTKDEITTILSKIDDLQPITNYCFKTNSGYHLDLITNGEVDKDKVTFIVKIIVSGHSIDAELLEKIWQFSQKMYEENNLTFNSDSSGLLESTITEFDIEEGIKNALY